MVIATQNPIEQEGTYPLPEAQVDRFLLKARVDYPKKDEERQVLDRMLAGEAPPVARVLSGDDVRGLARRGARGLLWTSACATTWWRWCTPPAGRARPGCPRWPT